MPFVHQTGYFHRNILINHAGGKIRNKVSAEAAIAVGGIQIYRERPVRICQGIPGLHFVAHGGDPVHQDQSIVRYGLVSGPKRTPLRWLFEHK